VRVIFLDFDGVLHPFGTMRGTEFQPAAVARLNRIVAEGRIDRIVVSSDWRFSSSDYELQALLSAAGVVGIHQGGDGDPGPLWGGITPTIYQNRWGAIDVWLSTHPEFKQFVILDDMPAPGWKAKYAVRVDPSAALTDRDVQTALRILT
jgi:hypothetical protein